MPKLQYMRLFAVALAILSLLRRTANRLTTFLKESSERTHLAFESSEHHSRVVAPPGFAACLLVLDDTIRLHEWVAYHYTILPLTSLVIAVDPKSTNDSVAEIHATAAKWRDFGLDTENGYAVRSRVR